MLGLTVALAIAVCLSGGWHEWWSVGVVWWWWWDVYLAVVLLWPIFPLVSTYIYPTFVSYESLYGGTAMTLITNIESL